jgi:hypothetical protein
VTRSTIVIFSIHQVKPIRIRGAKEAKVRGAGHLVEVKCDPLALTGGGHLGVELLRPALVHNLGDLPDPKRTH